MRRVVRQLFLVGLVLVYGVGYTNTGYAMSPEQKKVYKLGINYFDIDPGNSCGGSSSLEGSGNTEKVWNYFIEQGLTPIAVAGIMGNFSQETGRTFDPAIKEGHYPTALPAMLPGSSPPHRIGFGIAQWTAPGRQDGLFSKMQAAGLSKYYGDGFGQPEVDATDMPANDIDALLQLELAYAWEGDGIKISDIADQLNAATSVDGDDGSTVLFHQIFEISNDNAAQIQQRIDDADSFLNLYGGDSATGGCSSAALGGVATIEDGVAWGRKFVQDTQSKYHPGGQDLKDKKVGGDIIIYRTDDRLVGGAGGCWGSRWCGQCTAVSGWFVTNMTDYSYGQGYGNEVVDNLKAKGVPTGDEPQPFSVFSWGSARPGHTGVVLGVLDNGEVITLENNFVSPHVLAVRQYDIKAEHPDVRFAYVGDKLKVDGVTPEPAP